MTIKRLALRSTLRGSANRRRYKKVSGRNFLLLLCLGRDRVRQYLRASLFRVIALIAAQFILQAASQLCSRASTCFFCTLLSPRENVNIFKISSRIAGAVGRDFRRRKRRITVRRRETSRLFLSVLGTFSAS